MASAGGLSTVFLLPEPGLTRYSLGAICKRDIFNAIHVGGTLGAAFLAGTAASVIRYRLVYHRLRSFPGPRMAALSKLYHAMGSVDGKSHLWLDDLHKRYGDFVRTGPTEIAIFHPDVLSVFANAHKNGLTKPAWYYLLRDMGGLNLHRNKQRHSVRRRIWLEALSKRAILDYRVSLNTCVDEFCELVRSSAGKPVDFSAYCAWFGWDFMGIFSFSRSSDMMKTRGWDRSIKLLRNDMALLAPATPVPWAFHLAIDIPILREARIVRNMLTMDKANMNERIKVDKPMADISEHFIQWSKDRNTIEQDLEAMQGDGITLMIAGSDTTTVTVQFVFNALARHGDHLPRLRLEVDQMPEPMNPDDLASLPYLNGLTNEAMRLFPAVPTAGLRETLPEGLLVAGVYIPGNTVIYAPRYTFGRLESCFERPLEVIPERWSSRPELVKQRNSFQPFAAGMYSCVGKNLALDAVRLLVATVARKFDLKFASPEGVGKVENTYRDNITAVASDLNLVLTERKIGAAK